MNYKVLLPLDQEKLSHVRNYWSDVSLKFVYKNIKYSGDNVAYLNVDEETEYEVYFKKVDIKSLKIQNKTSRKFNFDWHKHSDGKKYSHLDIRLSDSYEISFFDFTGNRYDDVDKVFCTTDYHLEIYSYFEDAWVRISPEDLVKIWAR